MPRVITDEERLEAHGIKPIIAGKAAVELPVNHVVDVTEDCHIADPKYTQVVLRYAFDETTFQLFGQLEERRIPGTDIAGRDTTLIVDGLSQNAATLMNPGFQQRAKALGISVVELCELITDNAPGLDLLLADIPHQP